jgi:hypothetical protein
VSSYGSVFHLKRSMANWRPVKSADAAAQQIASRSEKGRFPAGGSRRSAGRHSGRGEIDHPGAMTACPDRPGRIAAPIVAVAAWSRQIGRRPALLGSKPALPDQPALPQISLGVIGRCARPV